jgi:hypothetical protein
MYRRSDWLELGFLVLGFVLLYTGIRLNFPILTNLGNISIGVFALVGGIQAIIIKRLGFETRQRNFGPREMYTGLAAQLWGILLIAFAMLVFILTGIAWFYPGGTEAFWSNFLGRPWGWGIISLCIGLPVMVSGIIHLLAGSAGYYKGLADLVERISGVIPLVIGSGLAFLGLLLILVPTLVMSLAQQMLSSLQQWFLH